MNSNQHSHKSYAPEMSYDWNFENVPALSLSQIDIPECPGEWTFCGLPVASPCGIAAGPLLNGKWITYYAQLGFDLLTYKTVRSRQRDCYELPNLAPVKTGMMNGSEDAVELQSGWSGSWAVSFGMPSKQPEFWTKDIATAKENLKPGQLLSVSVVGTMQPGWDLTDLANDYADCAETAFRSGADTVEMNFSCPNVCSTDGQLFQVPGDAGFVAARVREVVGNKQKLLVKIGYLTDDKLLQQLLCKLGDSVDAIVTTNSIPARVTDASGQKLFQGEQRGICGRAIRDASIAQVARCVELIDRQHLEMSVIGVGGIETAADVQRYLDAGAESVQLATAVMRDPLSAIRIRNELRSKHE